MRKIFEPLKIGLVASCLLCLHSAQVQAVTWTGGAGNWDDTGTPGWGAAEPTSTQFARLNGANPGPVTVNTANQVAYLSLDGNSTLIVDPGANLEVLSRAEGDKSIYIARNEPSVPGSQIIVNGGLISGTSGDLWVGGFQASEVGTLTIHGGEFRSEGGRVHTGSTLNLTGGTLDTSFHGPNSVHTGPQTFNIMDRVGGDGGTYTQTGGDAIHHNFQVRDTASASINNGTLVTKASVFVRDTATFDINGGVVATTSNFSVGRNNAGNTATVNQNAGYVTVGNQLQLALDNNNNTGVYNLNGGVLDVKGLINMNAGTGGTGILNINGGTLKFNDINVNNDAASHQFNWNAGTLTKTEFFDTVIKWVDDLADNTPLVIGNNNTGDGNAILDLGETYLSGGPNQTLLDGDGGASLDLSANDDQLNAVDRMLHYRQGGVGAVNTGSITLLRDFDGGITGTFDYFGGVGLPLFSGDASTLSSPADLPLNTVFLAYVDASGDHSLEGGAFDGTVVGVRLWYNVQGAAPEPSTAAFIVMGTLLLRLTRNRHFNVWMNKKRG